MLQTCSNRVSHQGKLSLKLLNGLDCLLSRADAKGSLKIKTLQGKPSCDTPNPVYQESQLCNSILVNTLSSALPSPTAPKK
jgi:hypothetical protein